MGKLRVKGHFIKIGVFTENKVVLEEKIYKRVKHHFLTTSNGQIRLEIIFFSGSIKNLIFPQNVPIEVDWVSKGYFGD